MSDSSQLDHIRAARAAAALARKRMEGSVEAMKAALQPKAIASDALERVKDLGSGIAGEVYDTVKGSPITATGVGAALTVAVGKRSLKWLSRKLARSPEKDATGAEATTFNVNEETMETQAPTLKARSPRKSEGVIA